MSETFFIRVDKNSNKIVDIKTDKKDLGKEQFNTHLSNFISQLQPKNDDPYSSTEENCGEPFEKTAGKDRYDDYEFLGNNAENGNSNYGDVNENYSMPILHKMTSILKNNIVSRINEEKNKKLEKNEALTSSAEHSAEPSLSAEPSPSAVPFASSISSDSNEEKKNQNDLILEQMTNAIKNKLSEFKKS